MSAHAAPRALAVILLFALLEWNPERRISQPLGELCWCEIRLRSRPSRLIPGLGFLLPEGPVGSSTSLHLFISGLLRESRLCLGLRGSSEQLAVLVLFARINYCFWPELIIALGGLMGTRRSFLSLAQRSICSSFLPRREGQRVGKDSTAIFPLSHSSQGAVQRESV